MLTIIKSNSRVQTFVGLKTDRQYLNITHHISTDSLFGSTLSSTNTNIPPAQLTYHDWCQREGNVQESLHVLFYQLCQITTPSTRLATSGHQKTKISLKASELWLTTSRAQPRHIKHCTCWGLRGEYTCYNITGTI